MSDNTQTIQIEALDTLFFRDGKPFSMGEDTWADGIFPPPPSVIYGALRTAWASENNIPVDKIEEKTKDLVITKIYYQFGGDIYFPMPLDLVIEKAPNKKEKKQRENNNKYTALLLDKFIENTISSFTIKQLITFNDEKTQIENLDSGIVIKTVLQKYINKKGSYTAKNLKNIVKTEDKIGIARDNLTNTTSESMLYRVGMKRIEDFKINIEFTGLQFNADAILKLGGETKTAKYKLLKDDISISQNSKIKSEFKSTQFKLVLLTPAYFKNGYLPSWINKNNYEVNYFNNKLKLTNCITGKPILQGGFDMKRIRPKKMQKLVPAGSVYYFEIQNTTDPNDIFNKVSISDNSDETDYQKQGYGHFIIAKV